MTCKSLVLWLTVFAVIVATLGLNLDHLEAQPEDMNDDVEDPVRDLEWLRLLGEEQRPKRRRFDKSDPRSLFTAVYSNYPYTKRFSADSFYDPREVAALAQKVDNKRGLKSRLDPKNLFKSAYGFKK